VCCDLKTPQTSISWSLRRTASRRSPIAPKYNFRLHRVG
jgi:hypothetical protein